MSYSSDTTLCAYPPGGILNSFTIPLPPVVLRFRSPLSSVEETDIFAMGAEVVRYSGYKGTVYTIRNPSFDTYRRIVSLPNLDESPFTPNMGHITTSAITTVMDIQSRITGICRILQDGFPGEQSLFKFHFVADTESIECISSNDLEDDDDEGEIDDDQPMESTGNSLDTDTAAVVASAQVWGGLDSTLHLLYAGTTTQVRMPYGSLAERNVLDGGLLFPFVSRYAASDAQSLAKHFTTFQHLYIENEDDTHEELQQLLTHWTREISKTQLGYRLSHMLTSLDIAIRANTSIFFIIENGEYQGAIVNGGGYTLSRLGGGVIHALSEDDLVKECSEFGFHSSLLREVFRVAGVEYVAVSSMRELHTRISPLGLDAMQKRTIEGILPKLSFAEEMWRQNPTTMTHLIEFLTSCTDNVPANWPLHYDAFFSTSRTELALAAFGRMAPTFRYGGTHRHACTEENGGEVKKTEPYKPSPPTILQSGQNYLKTSAAQWDVLLRTGIIATAEGDVSGGRKWSGADKEHLWKCLSDGLRDSVSLSKKEGRTGGGSGTVEATMETGGRKRNRDIAVEDEAKKKRRVAKF